MYITALLVCLVLHCDMIHRMEVYKTIVMRSVFGFQLPRIRGRLENIPLGIPNCRRKDVIKFDRKAIGVCYFVCRSVLPQEEVRWQGGRLL